ncbi:Annexin A1 [Pelobates cultripes]|uniref:Annexin n=1 Tax=Pelobates cultripes TaxID=61616 RepID=A0AAD1W952_PELCU|nr:Annexin A1 [Pelobates cultripes]
MAMEQQTSSVIQQILQSSQQKHVTSNESAQDSSGFKPRPKFDASQDVIALEKAINSKEVDVGTIIDIITKRTNEQRQTIKAAYQEKTGKSLDEALKKALSGPLRDIILALLKTPAQFDADSLKNAMKGLGTDEETIIEIIVSRSNQEIKQIKKVYQEEYKTDLEKDVIGDTSGDFQKILLALLKGERSEDSYVNEDLADKDAKALFEAGEKNKKADSVVFINILTIRSIRQLRSGSLLVSFLVFQRYAKISKHDITKVLDLKLKGDFERCMVAIVKCVTNKPAFFAEKLHLAMKGIGTRNQTLTRVMVSRSEIDIKNIKAEYETLYKKSLREALLVSF